MATISGTLLDALSNPVARTLRLYRRDTGALLDETMSSAATGDYSFTTAHVGEVQVIMLDDVAGSVENDQILRTVAV